MQRSLQSMSVWQRRLVFFGIFGVLLLGLVAVTLLLVVNALNNNGVRATSVALVPQATVRQFAALPDDDAYPESVAVAPDGTVYTGSFATGTLWQITPDGAVSEVPGTRDGIGAAMGIAVAPDGSLLVVDQLDTDPRTAGGKIVRVQDGKVSTFADMSFIAPNDLTLDPAGQVYLSDSGTDEVWRFDADGSNGAVWWKSSASTGSPHPAIGGLAYDPANDAIIVTDSEINQIYSVSVADASTTILYANADPEHPAGFNGTTVTPDGAIYVAALGQDGIARVDDGALDYIAGLFRGASDVAFAAPNRLYVTNFDQSSIVIPLVHPQLPFALDVVELAQP